MKYTREEVYDHWYNFLLRNSDSNIDFMQLFNIIQEAFFAYYQPLIVRLITGIQRRTFIILKENFRNKYAIFDFEITDGKKKADPQNPEPGQVEFGAKFKFIVGRYDQCALGPMQEHEFEEKNVEVIDFLYEYCNPEFIDIIEKISWEING